MTRDEILALAPGPELDKLVAEKVMGWEVVESGDSYYCDGVISYKCGTMRYGGNSYSFSNDIWAAFEVVKKMNELGWKHTINLLDDHRFEEPTHHCCFGTPKFKEAYAACDFDHVRAYSTNSPAEAICKAALLAVSAE